MPVAPGQPTRPFGLDGGGSQKRGMRRAVAERMFVVSGQVQVVGRGAAGQADVATLLAEGPVAEDEAGLNGAALGFVQGHGVAVVEVPTAEPGLVEGDASAVSELHNQPVSFERADGPPGPVQQLLVMLIAGDDDLVAFAVVDRPVLGPDLQRPSAERTFKDQLRADELVEVGDVAAVRGEDGDLPRVGLLPPGVEVVGDGLGAKVVAVGVQVQPVMLLVGVEGGGGVSAAKRHEGFAFPLNARQPSPLRVGLAMEPWS